MCFDPFEGREEAGLEAGEHYNLDKEDKYKGTDDGDEHQQHEEGLYDDEPEQVHAPTGSSSRKNTTESNIVYWTEKQNLLQK